MFYFISTSLSHTDVTDGNELSKRSQFKYLEAKLM
jgi:hypothetical protein